MSKITESTITINDTPQTQLVNYEAIEYLGWLNSDVQNVQTWCSSLFRGATFNGDKNLPALKVAVEKALQEVQDDIDHLKEFVKNLK